MNKAQTSQSKLKACRKLAGSKAAGRHPSSALVVAKQSARARHFELTGGDPAAYAKLLVKTYHAEVKRRGKKSVRPMANDPVIAEVRRVRHEISAAHGHDMTRLTKHYQEFEKELRKAGKYKFAKAAK